MGLVLGGRAQVVLTGHADASWVDDLATQRSSQGYTFSLGSGSVSWRSTRSSSVLNSSCEAEIYAGAIAAQELRWLTYLLTDLGEAPRSPPVLYVDNKAMLALCQEHRLEHRTKHIALRYFLARELQLRGQRRLAYVASRANIADVFTKALQPCSAPAGPSGSGGVRGAGEAGRGVAGGSAPIASVSSPAKDDEKAFNLEKLSGEDWASWSFRMELLFNHYGLLEVMDGELKRPASEGATKEWDCRSKDGFFLLSQCLSSNQLHHVKHLIKDIQCGPKAWKILKDVHAPSSEAMVVVLERQGLQITRDMAARTITLTQSHMVEQILTRFRFPFSKVQLTPLAVDHGLTAPHSDESFESNGPYPELVGCLMYLMTCTRPDLAYPLSFLARFVVPGRHRPSHWYAAKRVAKYVASKSGM
ncbi:unnamed protein product [Closterium sp. NIES-54]